MKILFSLFLISHGWIHASYLSKTPEQKPGAPQWPFALDHSWLLSFTGIGPGPVKALGYILVILATLGFTMSGLGWWGIVGLKSWWVQLTIFSSICSLLLLFLYWNTTLVLGVLIDVIILYLIYLKNLKPL